MTRRTLLMCGAISSLLYVLGIDGVAALAHPDYHGYADQMVSELLAVGAPTRGLLVALFVPYNLLVFAFAAGVWMSARASRSLHITALCLFGYALLSTGGLLLFPMDLRGTVDSTRDPLHIAATGVMSLFIVASMVAGAFTHDRRFRRYSFATVATVVAFGGLAGLLARPMPGPTPWIGLAERVNIYASMAWLAALSIVHLRRSRAA